METVINNENEAKKQNKKKWMIPVGIVVALAIVMIIIIISSRPKVVEISAQYSGDRQAGVVLDENNEGFIIRGITEDGERLDISGWKIEQPVTLEPDESAEIVIQYKDLSYVLNIKCTSSAITKINAEYYGDTQEGVEINNQSYIIVRATHKDGSVSECDGWTIENPGKLKADSTETLTVLYEEFSCQLNIECSTSVVTGIEAEYRGDTKAGVEINQDSDFLVNTIHKNGTNQICTDWTIKEPVVLAADETSDVTICYDTFETKINIECSTHTIVELSASYDGETKAGTVLNESNKSIHVKAKYKNGEEKEVTDFTIDKEIELKAGETASLKIAHEDQECELKVECSTLSESQYKTKCKSIAYKDLARNPDKYDGEMVKFTGKVVQTIGNDGVGALRVNVTKGRYGYDDTVYVMYSIDSSNRILEDDIISFYGISMGLYSYESVMGATITIPEVLAVYVDLN